MPHLRDLQISLSEESHVDIVIQKIPQLQYLNNLAVERVTTGSVESGQPSLHLKSWLGSVESEENYLKTQVMIILQKNGISEIVDLNDAIEICEQLSSDAAREFLE